jgi:hypothetical protein
VNDANTTLGFYCQAHGVRRRRAWTALSRTTRAPRPAPALTPPPLTDDLEVPSYSLDQASAILGVAPSALTGMLNGTRPAELRFPTIEFRKWAGLPIEEEARDATAP